MDLVPWVEDHLRLEERWEEPEEEGFGQDVSEDWVDRLLDDFALGILEVVVEVLAGKRSDHPLEMVSSRSDSVRDRNIEQQPFANLEGRPVVAVPVVH